MKPVEAIGATRPVDQGGSVKEQADGPARNMREVAGPEEGEAPDRSHLLREILQDLGIDGKDPTKVDVSYTLHEETGRPLIIIRSRDTREVLRTVPPEQLLNVVARIMEYVGLLMDETV